MKEKKYTGKTLEAAVRKYFKTISRTVKVTERVPTEKRDKKGHVIYRDEAVMNELGKQATIVEFLSPPTVGGLCAFLGIHRSTWADYADAKKNPEFREAVSYARDVMKTWREEQLLMRKDVKGIVFDLQNNWDYTDKKEIELGPHAADAIKPLPLSDRLEALNKITEIINDRNAD